MSNGFTIIVISKARLVVSHLRRVECIRMYVLTVEDIDDTLARLGKRGAELVGEVVQYENSYRLCYIRGPEGILIGLAQELGQQTSR